MPYNSVVNNSPKNNMPPARPSSRPFHNRDEFLRFVREVSPHADPASVLLFGAVHRLHAHLLQSAERRLADATGLTWPKYRLLIMLAHGERDGRMDGMLPSELSTQQDISRNTASSLIAGLEADGFISRALVESDRRKFRIRLTPKGRRTVKAQMGNHFEHLGSCFANLSAEERAQLLSLLDRVQQDVANEA